MHSRPLSGPSISQCSTFAKFSISWWILVPSRGHLYLNYVAWNNELFFIEFSSPLGAIYISIIINYNDRLTERTFSSPLGAIYISIGICWVGTATVEDSRPLSGPSISQLHCFHWAELSSAGILVPSRGHLYLNLLPRIPCKCGSETTFCGAN